MDGVDKEKVQRIVYEMSKGSKYFENEQRKEAFTRQKIESMRAQYAKLTAADISHYQTVQVKWNCFHWISLYSSYANPIHSKGKWYMNPIEMEHFYMY